MEGAIEKLAIVKLRIKKIEQLLDDIKEGNIRVRGSWLIDLWVSHENSEGLHLDDFVKKNLTVLVYFLSRFDNTKRQNAMAHKLLFKVENLARYWIYEIFPTLNRKLQYPNYEGTPEKNMDAVLQAKFGEFNKYLLMIITATRQPTEFIIENGCLSEPEIKYMLIKLKLH